MISQKVLGQIIQAANLSKKSAGGGPASGGDTVLEIGPGLGAITQELAQRAKRVVAVEKDRKMVEILKETLKDYENIEIIHGDILKIKNLKLKIINYKVVANLPHYITSPVLRLFLESKNPPQEMTLLIQKEVAQRICARLPKMNLLAITIQLYSQPKIIASVSKKSFWPKPKVDSAIIKITPYPPAILNTSEKPPGRFFKIVKAGFSSPRKQLVNNLSKKLNLDKEKIKKALTQCHFDTRVRAQNLGVSDWVKLSEATAAIDESW